MLPLLSYRQGLVKGKSTILYFSGKRKLDVSKYPRDKVILFQVRRGPFAPSMSPFALKLETYLRMAEIPYQVRPQNVHVVLFYLFILVILMTLG